MCQQVRGISQVKTFFAILGRRFFFRLDFLKSNNVDNSVIVYLRIWHSHSIEFKHMDCILLSAMRKRFEEYIQYFSSKISRLVRNEDDLFDEICSVKQ